jgi:hypothetical protein
VPVADLHVPGIWCPLAGLEQLLEAHQERAPFGAALLGAATGISWGFVAAVIKELRSHLGEGISAIFSNWSPYILVVVGAAAMLLASHALAAGPLAASQSGFTILDPFSASVLGQFLFSEHIQDGLWIWSASRWPWPPSSPV